MGTNIITYLVQPEFIRILIISCVDGIEILFLGSGVFFCASEVVIQLELSGAKRGPVRGYKA